MTDHRQTYAIVGELVMMANALDFLLNRVVIAAFSLQPTPLLEPVIATIDSSRKIEMLKKRAKLITNLSWKKAMLDFCKTTELVFKQRNIACHNPAYSDGQMFHFKPIAAAKLFQQLDLDGKTIKNYPPDEMKAAIQMGEAALGIGVNLLENLDRINAEMQKRRK